MNKRPVLDNTDCSVQRQISTTVLPLSWQNQHFRSEGAYSQMNRAAQQPYRSYQISGKPKREKGRNKQSLLNKQCFVSYKFSFALATDDCRKQRQFYPNPKSLN